MATIRARSLLQQGHKRNHQVKAIDLQLVGRNEIRIQLFAEAHAQLQP